MSAKSKPDSSQSRRPAETGTPMRDKLLKAAHAIFSERGYPGTSTRELAAAAGVTERTLFRYFPTKPLIFQAAIVAPFHDAIESYVSRWERRQPGINDPASETSELFVDLFDVLNANRGLVKALVAAHAFDSTSVDVDSASASTMAALLGRLQTVMEVEAKRRGWKLDAEITIRLLFGMLISSTVHADWLFEHPAPNRKRLLSELTALSVYGMAGRPKS